MSATVADFMDAIRAAGIAQPEHIEPDGVLHRFSTNGKPGDDSGWYVLHLDGIPAGAFGCYRSDVRERWTAKPNGKAWTDAEQAEQRKRVAAQRKQADADRTTRQHDAAERAAAIWEKATPATADHPYLVRKGIQPHGARTHTSGALIVPVYDAEKLHSLQFIPALPEEKKRFITGGRKEGCYFLIGDPNHGSPVCIAEGFATAASITEATGYAAAVAFDAGNLLAVSQTMQTRFPDTALILCADDDWKRERGNIGIDKAREAANAVGGLLAMPRFGAERSDTETDFNDMARQCGAEAVRDAITAAAQSASAAATGIESEPTPPNNADIPPIGERPCYRCFDGWTDTGTRKYKPGVWYFSFKESKEGIDLLESYVCSPLHVDAQTVDGQDNNFGRLLRFRTTRNKWRQWAMPMELLKGRGEELRGELLAMGALIDPKARQHFENYLQAFPPRRVMRCALQVGWCGDSFVLPDAVIGPAASHVIFQSGERGHDEHTRAGTLDAWKADISAHAIGNPLLMLALSAAFAGPLLAACNADSGGIHFVGDSSTGKTTLLEAACSVWGGPRFKRSWRATANGMEGAAALFNDCLLCLDEISECDPREVGPIVYALGNGAGKQRAGRSGAARSVTRWRCSVLSSGERTMATHMADGGHRVKAGQTVRLLDIPASRTFGAFDDLRGFTSGAALADAIKRAAGLQHGTAGRAFLERLTHDKRDFCEFLERIKVASCFAAGVTEGQDKRAATRFALMALAGELATEYGVTGWQESAALEAAAVGFTSWRVMRGKGNNERRQILEQLSAFIERNGDSRFSDADASDSHDAMRINRAGYWQDGMEGRAYLFNADGLREALKGFDFKRALDVLQQEGVLSAPGANGERAKPIRIGGRVAKLYEVRAEAMQQ